VTGAPFFRSGGSSSVVLLPEIFLSCLIVDRYSVSLCTRVPFLVQSLTWYRLSFQSQIRSN
jgi:hypothetical protein